MRRVGQRKNCKRILVNKARLRQGSIDVVAARVLPIPAKLLRHEDDCKLLVPTQDDIRTSQPQVHRCRDRISCSQFFVGTSLVIHRANNRIIQILVS
jgi:hypothetical protein